MRTLLHWAVRLYPADWRARYGQELHGLLDDMKPTWQDVVDVAMGGLQMQLRHSVVRPAVAFSIVGVCVASVVALTLPKQFVAQGVVSVRFREPTAGARMTTTFSSDELRSLLDAHHLFPSNGNQREEAAR
jgi:hypothetical protein